MLQEVTSGIRHGPELIPSRAVSHVTAGSGATLQPFTRQSARPSVSIAAADTAGSPPGSVPSAHPERGARSCASQSKDRAAPGGCPRTAPSPARERRCPRISPRAAGRSSPFASAGASQSPTRASATTCCARCHALLQAVAFLGGRDVAKLAVRCQFRARQLSGEVRFTLKAGEELVNGIAPRAYCWHLDKKRLKENEPSSGQVLDGLLAVRVLRQATRTQTPATVLLPDGDVASIPAGLLTQRPGQ